MPPRPTIRRSYSYRKIVRTSSGVAQRQIAHIQSDLQRTLKEQKHLADLGLAVSKINHDMRNILASAQLMSDRLADTNDPMVQRFAPKLIRTLSRAISYSESVIAYGRSQEEPPKPRRVLLRAIITDVQNTLNLSAESGIEFQNLVPENFELDVDSEQLFRVLSNLCRNSVQAMERDQSSDAATIRATDDFRRAYRHDGDHRGRGYGARPAAKGP